MARLIWCLVLAGFASPLKADSLGSDDRELLLEKLASLKSAAEERKGGRIGVALAAFRPAIGSADAAIELYLNCVEKLDFDDQHRKSQDFREWKRRQKDHLDDPSLRLALQLQLQWLVHSLEVAAKPGEIEKMAGKASNALDDIFNNAEKLAGQQNILRQSVTASVFARAYSLSDLDTGEWPTEPLALNQIYHKVILPPLRKPDKTDLLRAAWLKRIQQEAMMREHWSGWNPDGKIGTREALRPPAFEKFLADERPELIFRMEEDLFKAGDQRGAALRMLEHLEHYVGHPSAPDWTDRFIGLIAAEPEPAPATNPPADPAAPAPAPAEAGPQTSR